MFSAIKDQDGRGRVIDVVMPVTELDRANLIFERILYQGPTRQTPEREESAPSGPVRGPVEPSPDRDREPPQRPQAGRPGQEQAAPQEAREGPQRPPVPDRWDPPPPRSQLPDDPWEIPPKKDSRSGRDSRDTKTSSSTSREGGGMSDRPSILGRLEGYRARLEVKSRSVPAKEKTRAKPKAR